MPEFREILPERGVDEWASHMVVPLNDFNMILLRDGKNVKLYPKSQGGDVDIEEISSTLPMSIGARRIVKLYRNEVCSSTGKAAKRCAWFAERGVVSRLNVGLVAADALNARLFAVFGNRAGTVLVPAKQSGRTFATLKITCLREKNVSVAFRLVQHTSRGQIVPHAIEKGVHVRRWISVLNEIWSPQANVTFKLHSSEWVTVDSDLGPSVSKEQFWKHLVDKKHHGADWNVFVVGMYASETQGAFKGGGATPVNSGCSMVDETAGDESDRLGDKSSFDPPTLAHEACHFLLYPLDSWDDTLFGHPAKNTKIPMHLAARIER
jgi:hypothetical protein